MTPRIHLIQEKIRNIIARSKVPEDPIHAEDTLRILLELHPGADHALRLAALGHDIERAFPRGIRVEQTGFKSYDEFKWRHAMNSARIMRGILMKCEIDKVFVEKVEELVLHHEVGGTKEADILKDADSLSFFHTNLSLYMERESYERVLKRVKWGLDRLSPRGLKYLKERLVPNNKLLKKVIEMDNQYQIQER